MQIGAGGSQKRVGGNRLRRGGGNQPQERPLVLLPNLDKLCNKRYILWALFVLAKLAIFIGAIAALVKLSSG